MQISTAIDASTVAYLQGGYANNRFVASAGANWAGVAAGNWFSIVGSPNVPYDIVAVYPPGTGGNQTADRWELTIVGIINEGASAAAAYVIGIDFLSPSGMWDPQIRDTQTLQFLKRNLRLLNTLLGNATPIKVGNVALAADQQTFNIIGIPAQTAQSGIYVYRVLVLFENVTDSGPSVINYIVTSKQAAQCTVSLSPSPDSANTIARYAVFAT